MHGFLLTVSAVLLLLTCGLSKPMSKRATIINPNIVKALEAVKCENVVFSAPLRVEDINKDFPAAAKCFQEQLEKIPTNCSHKIATAGHIINALNRITKNKAKCTCEKQQTESYKSFLEELTRFLQQYNNWNSSK